MPLEPLILEPWQLSHKTGLSGCDLGGETFILTTTKLGHPVKVTLRQRREKEVIFLKTSEGEPLW